MLQTWRQCRGGAAPNNPTIARHLAEVLRRRQDGAAITLAMIDEKPSWSLSELQDNPLETPLLQVGLMVQVGTTPHAPGWHHIPPPPPLHAWSMAQQRKEGCEEMQGAEIIEKC
jgi:hypothetical protein